MDRRIFLSGGTALAGTMLLSRQAEAASWKFLGIMTGGYRSREVIHVGADKGRFRRIKFFLDSGRLRISDIRIVLADRRIDDHPLDSVLEPLTIAAVDVLDEPQRIDRIYATLRGRGHITVSGLRV